MTATRDRIPVHLRQYVVDQDYDAYDEVDQAVWRFVLLQTYDRLCKTAHPAYIDGLRETGISVERIPRVEEMDACLAEYGWGAVVVDGFIPPRAFQEFQDLQIMTIAAAIRRRRHLAYTPAPDIIHESAGHAPIVPDAEYKAFLKRFGEIGKRCFSSSEDQAVYEAIRHLSEVKEDRASTRSIIDDAQTRLDAALEAVSWDSEAALLTRLHWWTVEYGLIGTTDDFKICGAGLLSSLGESTSCLKAAVKKIPLSVDCTQTSYDITRPQPQLFVCRDFVHLNDVLEEFAESLAQRRGGSYALEMMMRSSELGTVELNSGTQITGILDEVIESDGKAIYLRFRDRCALSLADQILPGQEPEHHESGFGTPIGPLADGSALETMDADQFAACEYEDGKLRLEFASGVVVEGVLGRTQSDESGMLRVITIEDARVAHGDRVLFEPEWGLFDMAVGSSVTSCFAGSPDDSFYEATAFSRRTVPSAKDPETAAEEGRVLHLYRQVLAIWEKPEATDLVERFTEIHVQLGDHADEWLLRWNLLECLCKVDRGASLREKLRDELLVIEQTDFNGLPITTGLRYLGMA